MLKKLFDIDPSFFESFALIHRVSEIIVRCVLKDMQQMLAQRLSAVATGTLIYEMQLFKNQNKLKGDSPEKQYDYFCDSILSNPNYIEELFSVYPCLQRAIFECLANCVNNYVEFLCRLKKDHTQLVKKFCANKEFKDLVSCSSGASDSHNGGKSVTIFTLDNGTRVVYKPHSLTVDRRYAFSSLRYPVIIQITSYSVSYLLPQKVFLIILKIFFREKETTLILAVCLEENLR